jgi:hypothetical protein
MSQMHKSDAAIDWINKLKTTPGAQISLKAE